MRCTERDIMTVENKSGETVAEERETSRAASSPAAECIGAPLHNRSLSGFCGLDGLRLRNCLFTAE